MLKLLIKKAKMLWRSLKATLVIQFIPLYILHMVVGTMVNMILGELQELTQKKQTSD